MDIRELRHSVGMTQGEFSRAFGIPIGTLRNWEQGISKPPAYVFTMIFSSIRRDIMINVETMKLISIMNTLAKRSKNGIVEFSEANSKNFDDKVFYDKNTADENGSCRVVCDACLIEDSGYEHHDIISYWDDLVPGCSIRVMLDDEFGHTIDVTMEISKVAFTIDDGEWYCTNFDT